VWECLVVKDRSDALEYLFCSISGKVNSFRWWPLCNVNSLMLYTVRLLLSLHTPTAFSPLSPHPSSPFSPLTSDTLAQVYGENCSTQMFLPGKMSHAKPTKRNIAKAFSRVSRDPSTSLYESKQSLKTSWRRFANRFANFYCIWKAITFGALSEPIGCMLPDYISLPCCLCRVYWW